VEPLMHLRKLIAWLEELEQQHGDVNVMVHVEPNATYNDRLVTSEAFRVTNREEWLVQMFATLDDEGVSNAN
jgi:hypothetical protein